MVANEGLPPLKGTTRPSGALDGIERPFGELREAESPSRAPIPGNAPAECGIGDDTNERRYAFRKALETVESGRR